MVWDDVERTKLMSKTLIDFTEMAFYEISTRDEKDGSRRLVCEKTQYGETVMGVLDILRIFWTPSRERYVSYQGLQCLDPVMNNVLAFEGINANGEVWYAYFDARTRALTKAINVGFVNKKELEIEGDGLSRNVSFNVDAYIPKLPGFTDEEMRLEECFDGSIEVIVTEVNDHIVPLGDLGFFMN
jgi:hypothetical protein